MGIDALELGSGKSDVPNKLDKKKEKQMGILKKAKKKAKKTTKKAVKETKKAVHSAIKKVDNINWSKEVNQLTQDAKNTMKDLGDDLEKAVKNAGMQKILKELAQKLVKENKEVINTMKEVGKKIAKETNMKKEIKDIVQKQEKGQLDFKQVQELKKKAGLENFFK